jgi:hypothetical protein
LSAKPLEGGGGRGHPDFHDGREHHLDDDRHFPERQRKQLFGASSRICPWGTATARPPSTCLIAAIERPTQLQK